MKAWLNRYKVLVLFGSITLLTMVLLYGGSTGLDTMLGRLDTATAIALAFMAFMGYKEFIISENKIPIVFQDEASGEKLTTDINLLRKNCTRSEVLGVLGMLQVDSKNKFNLTNDKMKRLLMDSQAIQLGEQNELVIKLSADELQQFDIHS
jgi:hypothetical protein